MADILKLSQNEWVMFFVQDGWNQVGRIQDGCHHQVQWEWMSLSQNELVWVRVRVEGDVFEWIWEKKARCLNSTMQKLNPRWQNSRWPPSSSWVKRNEWSFLVQMLEREVWVKFFCANGGNQSWQVWVSLRGKIKMAESKMVEFKMAANIKLSQNEWVMFFVQDGWSQVGRIQDGCHHQVQCKWMGEGFLCKWWEPILASVSEFERKN